MKPIRVLLIWPGSDGSVGGNFGVPQLLSLATYARQETGAHVDIRDLHLEVRLGNRSWSDLLSGPDGDGYDIVGFSVYSSFDWLKCQALVELARNVLPDALYVAGGYHPSARPQEMVDGGFDVAVVGEGEKPLVAMIESIAGGDPIRGVMASDAVMELDALPLTDWSYLERYRPLFRDWKSQAQLYLSRGCPFDCAFCMERAKREVSWRSFSVDRAIAEVQAMQAFLRTDGWTVNVADALFGMKRKWRREFLQRLSELDLPFEKFWTLIRVDLVDDDDLRLFGAANFSLGFGLESGDGGQLALIRKTGRLDDYLDRMRHIADRSRVHGVPWGANIICGHPGETRETLQNTADFMRELFLTSGGTTGFLSVDPFRLYPGSPIDQTRKSWEDRFGTVFHRPGWWEDGDQAFLSEWVDASSDLDWRTTERLSTELLAPVLHQIEENFSYDGPGRDYFVRAMRQQVDFIAPRNRLYSLDRYYAWRGYLGDTDGSRAARRTDPTLGQLTHALRADRVELLCAEADLEPDHPIAQALRDVPRERFVPTDKSMASVEDVALWLDATELASVSAMHAYAHTFRLAGIAPGDVVLDLGAGTGYGTSILARLVGEDGRAHGVEFDPELARIAAAEGAPVIQGDALDPSTWGIDPATVDKVVVGFAVPELPMSWARALSPGTVVVAPVGTGRQTLSRAVVGPLGYRCAEQREAVRYVPARGPHA